MTMQHLARPMAIFLSALAWCVAAIAAEPLPLAGPPWGVMAGDGDAIPAGIVKRAQDLGLPWFRPPAVLLPQGRRTKTRAPTALLPRGHQRRMRAEPPSPPQQMARRPPLTPVLAGSQMEEQLKAPRLKRR